LLLKLKWNWTNAVKNATGEGESIFCVGLIDGEGSHVL
jgi:hypothetical protein